MSKISAVVITFNESSNIKRCIESLVEIVDEVIVVDSFSTDDTVAIAESLGANVIQHKFEGFGCQKSFATQQATNKWILSLDADECLSAELRQSIAAIKDSLDTNRVDAYSFNRRNYYCNKRINYSGWYPDKKVRLFNRECVAWSDSTVHESVVLDDKTPQKHLYGDLLHYTCDTIETHKKKMAYYAKLAAAEFKENGKTCSRAMAILRSIFRFVKIYIFKLGVLDGYYGFVLSLVEARYVFWKYSWTKK